MVVIISGYTVIADVGLTLVQLFRTRMVPEPILQQEAIGLGSPDKKGDLNLSLYLYHIEENGQARRTEMISQHRNTLQYPPLSINLSYLLTAYSSADDQTRVLDEHRILGRAMQILHDHSILRGEVLQGALKDSDEELRMVLDPIHNENIQRIWNFPSTPYKLSIGLTVGPVLIDSTRTKDAKRVLERQIRLEDRTKMDRE